MELSDLKKRYAELAKKHNLPSFSDLNEDFEIEKIEKGGETLLRTVRKTILEKVVNFMNFLEFLLNPINAPRMYLIYVKSMSAEDRKEIEGIYGKLARITLSSLKLEIDYSEKGEAEMIKTVAKTWGEIKPGFMNIVESIQKPASFNGTKEKSYFG